MLKRNPHREGRSSWIEASRSAAAVSTPTLRWRGRVVAHLPAPERLIALIGTLVMLVWLSVGSTLAGYFDTETSSHNTFIAGTWDNTPPPQVGGGVQTFSLVISPPSDFVTDDSSSTDQGDATTTDTATDTPPVVEISDPVTTINPPADTPPTDQTPPADTPPGDPALADPLPSS